MHCFSFSRCQLSSISRDRHGDKDCLHLWLVTLEVLFVASFVDGCHARMICSTVYPHPMHNSESALLDDVGIVCVTIYPILKRGLNICTSLFSFFYIYRLLSFFSIWNHVHLDVLYISFITDVFNFVFVFVCVCCQFQP